MKHIASLFGASPYWHTAAALCSLILVAALAHFAVRRLLLRGLHKLLRFTKYSNDPDIRENDIAARLATIVPALVIIIGISFVPGIPAAAVTVIRNTISAFIILTVALALGTALNIANTLYMRRPDAANKPIKGYLQILKIGIYSVTAILIIAVLIDKSPLILLSGLGAMAAVLMLIFQDTLLSLVASVQISSSDMVRVGDWIEMPQLNADGDVIDIALHTVKVQNWDKTITTLPTRRLVSDPFKNWRGMQEFGGRRIKRAIYLDQASIRFLTGEEKRRLKTFALLEDYIADKERKLEDWNASLGEHGKTPANTRRLTNAGTFRAYVGKYLEHNAAIASHMTLLVRQLAPGPQGLPIEIYCFTNTTAWAQYEGIQSDIFDHLYAILPEFGLRAYQQPSGADLRDLGIPMKMAG
jgi:miniconductance mechanosensitive channel